MTVATLHHAHARRAAPSDGAAADAPAGRVGPLAPSLRRGVAHEARLSPAHATIRVRNRWLGGAQSRTTIGGLAPGQGVVGLEAGADEPRLPTPRHGAATPAEHLLHAVAASLTASLVYVAATRGVRLTDVESSLVAELEARGPLGRVGPAGRSAFRAIRISLLVRGEATERELRGIVALARRRSAVLDLVASGVRVEVEVHT